MGANNCLSCHRDGGFVPPFEAYAPVTPHPQLGNCRQCHVPNKEKGTFRASMWEKIPGPPIDGEALVGGPPPMPHELQMRENCVACHAGPGAVAEIRTPHPERVNCRQCHVDASKNESDEQAFRRPLR
jgi:cytochrome c-type protein NapB